MIPRGLLFLAIGLVHALPCMMFFYTRKMPLKRAARDMLVAQGVLFLLACIILPPLIMGSILQVPTFWQTDSRMILTVFWPSLALIASLLLVRRMVEKMKSHLKNRKPKAS